MIDGLPKGTNTVFLGCFSFHKFCLLLLESLVIYLHGTNITVRFPGISCL